MRALNFKCNINLANNGYKKSISFKLATRFLNSQRIHEKPCGFRSGAGQFITSLKTLEGGRDYNFSFCEAQSAAVKCDCGKVKHEER